MLILAVWGGVFFYTCVQTLAAPGVPVRFDVQTENGALQLRADSYRLDMDNGHLAVNRLSLNDPQGGSLAKLERLDVEGLALIRKSGALVKVSADHLDLRVVRRADGSFPIFDYLPKKQPKGGDTPFLIRITQIHGRYLDFSAGNRLWVQSVDLPALAVDGIGDVWLASADQVNLSSIGNIEAISVQSDPQIGYLAHVRSRELQLASALRHFRDTPEGKRVALLQDLDAESLIAQGPVKLLLPQKSSFQTQADIVLDGLGVRYGDYKATRAHYDGLLTDLGTRGELEAEEGQNLLQFRGNLAWSGETEIGGQLTLKTPSSQVLPLYAKQLLPQKVSFKDGLYVGWLSYHQGLLRTDGELGMAQASFEKWSLDKLKLLVNLQPKTTQFQIVSADFLGAPLKGSAIYDLKTGIVRAGFEAEKISLASLASKFDVKRLRGTGTLRAIVLGTPSHPQISARFYGNADYRPSQAQAFQGRFRIATQYRDDLIQIQSASFAGNAGAVVAEGSIQPEKQAINLHLLAQGISLSALSSDLRGSGNFIGDVAGTFKQPSGQGRLEIYGLQAKGESIPIVTTDLFADSGQIVAKNFAAVRGGARAGGELAYRLKTGEIKGELEALGVPLKPFLGDTITGAIDLRKIQVAGTFEQPEIQATLEGNNIVAQQVLIDNLQAHALFKNQMAVLDDLSVRLAGGTLSGSGSYDLTNQIASLKAEANNLSLTELAPGIGEDVFLGGTLNGKIEAQSVRGDLSGQASGQLNDLSVNRTLIGSGSWNFGLQENKLQGALDLGSPERYVQVPSFHYDLKTEDFDAEATVYRLPLKDLYAIGQRYLPANAADLRNKLYDTSGTLSANVNVIGTPKGLDFSVPLLEAKQIQVGDRPLGDLTAQFSKQGNDWTVQQLSLIGPAGEIQTKGTAVQDGPINLDAEVSNLDLSLVGLFAPKFGALQGKADISMLVSGQTRSPEIQASLRSDQFSVQAGEAAKQTFSVLLDTLTFKEATKNSNGEWEGGLNAQGAFFYKGLRGNLSASLPMMYPFEIPAGASLNAQVSVPERSLTELGEFSNVLDEKRTQGSLRGEVSLSGPLDRLEAKGAIEMKAENLAMNQIQTTLKNLSARVDLTGNALTFKADADSSRNGKVSAHLNASLAALGESLQEFDFDRLMQIPLDGSLDLTTFAVKQELPDEGSLSFVGNGSVKVSGPLATPLLSGTLDIYNARGKMPSTELAASGGGRFPINPRFDLHANLENPAKIGTSAADLTVTGGGDLRGSLTEPDAEATFETLGGTIRLPTARVRIEPGGTARVRYQGTPDSPSVTSVDVDLEGRTNLTALRYGNEVQRYEIILSIRGDLMKEGGLNLIARSEPDDLGQDKILAMLGQTDVLSGLVEEGFGGSAEQKLRQALTGAAVPFLFERLTGNLASTLGFDYISLELDPLQQTSISFARSFGKGLSLQGTRQISEPLPGSLQRYDIRLVYRLPFRKGIFERINFSVGTDEVRPWKIAVEYTKRF